MGVAPPNAHPSAPPRHPPRWNLVSFFAPLLGVLLVIVVQAGGRESFHGGLFQALVGFAISSTVGVIAAGIALKRSERVVALSVLGLLINSAILIFIIGLIVGD